MLSCKILNHSVIVYSCIAFLHAVKLFFPSCDSCSACNFLKQKGNCLCFITSPLLLTHFMSSRTGAAASRKGALRANGLLVLSTLSRPSVWCNSRGGCHLSAFQMFILKQLSSFLFWRNYGRDLFLYCKVNHLHNVFLIPDIKPLSEFKSSIFPLGVDTCLCLWSCM